jgi:hypothetical protein
MKTIKGAFSPTSKFLHFKKFPLLILIAVCGFLLGGTKTPETISQTAVTEKGGQQVQKDSNLLGLSRQLETVVLRSAFPVTRSLEIGGQTPPRTGDGPAPKQTGDRLTIGGQNQHVPKSGDPIGAVCDRQDKYEESICIGGNQGAPRVPPFFRLRNTFDIGGTQSVPQTPSIPGSGPAISGQNQEKPKTPNPLG